jgi:hypothetical protein
VERHRALRYATEHGPSPSLLADIELQRQADAVPKDRLPVVTVALAVTCIVAYVIEVDAYGLIPDATELREDCCSTSSPSA